MKWSSVSYGTQGISIPASPFVGKVLLIPAQQCGHGVVCHELQDWAYCMYEIENSLKSDDTLL